MNDVFKQVGHPNTNTRSSFLKLRQPLRKPCQGQNTLSYIAYNILDNLPDSLQTIKVLHTYKHLQKTFSRQNRK